VAVHPGLRHEECGRPIMAVGHLGIHPGLPGRPGRIEKVAFGWSK